jgi:hypothetical protein
MPCSHMITWQKNPLSKILLASINLRLLSFAKNEDDRLTQRKPFNTEAEIPPIETDVQETLAAPLLTTKKYDVVIVGAGLGGLTAAVEASLAGKTVLVIESRQERYSAIRPQLIYLQDGIIDYLATLNKRSKDKITAQDLLMFSSSSMLEHVGIKDIQRFLKRKSDNELCSFQYESKVM